MLKVKVKISPGFSSYVNPFLYTHQPPLCLQPSPGSHADRPVFIAHIDVRTVYIARNYVFQTVGLKLTTDRDTGDSGGYSKQRGFPRSNIFDRAVLV